MMNPWPQSFIDALGQWDEDIKRPHCTGEERDPFADTTEESSEPLGQLEP